MPDPTPGQVAYDAWRTRYYQGRAQIAVPWDVCSSDYQAAWEAAAQAVLTQAGLLALDLDPDVQKERRDA